MTVEGDVPQRRRKRRSDAQRSQAAVLDAAVRVLGARPDASVEEVAEAAAVTRQTVYAHYPSREALFNAVVDQISGQAVAEMDALDLDQGPPPQALRRFLAVGWTTFQRYPQLLRLAAADQDAEQERHEAVQERLARLIRRGRRSGDFDRSLPVDWLVTVVIELGHVAGEQVSAGRMSPPEAIEVLERTVLRVFGADFDDDPARKQVGH